MREFLNYRTSRYVINTVIYLAFYYILGFEFTMILVSATILGEIEYQHRNKL